MEGIEETLEVLNSSMATFNLQMKSLSKMNNSIVQFNQNFGSFLTALKMAASCVEFKDPVPLPNMPDLRKSTQGFTSNTTSTNSSASEKSSSTLTGSRTSVANRTSSMGTSSSQSRRKESDVIPQLMKKVLANLPPRYSDIVHKNSIEAIFKLLLSKPEGVYAQDIVTGANILKTKCTEYLNLLVKNGDIIKISKKGFLYLINYEKFGLNR